jgi:hypothetical protein
MLGWMIKHNIPLTRDDYIAAAWGPKADHPKEWGPEHEAQIPPFLRDPAYGVDES